MGGRQWMLLSGFNVSPFLFSKKATQVSSGEDKNKNKGPDAPSGGATALEGLGGVH